MTEKELDRMGFLQYLQANRIMRTPEERAEQEELEARYARTQAEA
jgi:hypothetical protein